MSKHLAPLGPQEVSSNYPTGYCTSNCTLLAFIIVGIASSVMIGLGAAQHFGSIGSKGFIASIAGGSTGVVVSGIAIWIIRKPEQRALKPHIPSADSSRKTIDRKTSAPAPQYPPLTNDALKSFFKAVYAGDMPQIQQHVTTYGPSILEQRQDGLTALEITIIVKLPSGYTKPKPDLTLLKYLITHSSPEVITAANTRTNNTPCNQFLNKYYDDPDIIALMVQHAGKKKDLILNKDFLSKAAIDNAHKTVKYLIEQGLAKEAQGEDGGMLLVQVCSYSLQEPSETIQLFIDAGADVNSTGIIGRTSLHLAVESGYKSVVTMLLKAKADIYAKDKNNGKTPYQLAQERKDPEIIALFKPYVKNSTREDEKTSSPIPVHETKSPTI